MAGIGRFKLSDALPKPLAESSRSARGGKNKASVGEAGSAELAAEQAREAHESSGARNAEASIRDRMVDIGRGNQQAGRQRAGGGRGK